MKASGQLRRLHQALSRCTVALAGSNRKLRKEIARRQLMERAFARKETESIRLLDQSQSMQDQLRHLSRQLLSTREDERKRISRELHDVIVQILASINMRLAALKAKTKVNTGGLARNIAHTQRLVKKSVDIVHRFAYDLRPVSLDYLGLVPALMSCANRFMKETGIRVRVTGSQDADKLDSTRRLALYRVAEEAMTNVTRHALADRVAITIRKAPKSVRMVIKDNGKSFDAKLMSRPGKGACMGLLGMRERMEMIGGTLSIEASPGKGTTIKAQVPFGKGTREHNRL